MNRPSSQEIIPFSAAIPLQYQTLIPSMQDVRSRMQFFGRMLTRIESAKFSKLNMGLEDVRLAIQKGYYGGVRI